MKLSNITLSLITTLLITFSAKAQLISQTQGSEQWEAPDIAQTFVAPADTQINAIAIKAWQETIADLYIYDSSGAVLYTQTDVTLTAASPDAPLQVISLDNLLSVSAGATYFFVLENTVPDLQVRLYVSSANPYSSGYALWRYTFFNQSGMAQPMAGYEDYDLAFAIYEYDAPIPVAEAKSIPSLSVWAMLILFVSFTTVLTLQTKKHLK